MAENFVEITSSEWKTKGKGKWLAVQIAGEKFPRNVMDKAAQAQFSGPGRYELTWKQDGEYLNIVGFKKLEPIQVLGANGKTETKPFTRELDPNVVLQNKSICAQVAVKAAADIVSAMCNKEFPNSAIDSVAIFDFSTTLAKGFMNTMKDFVNEKEPKPETNEFVREPIPVA